jgi:hypothetical protein
MPNDIQSEHEAYTKWLSELKPGDDAYILPRFATMICCKVSRVTATQIIVTRSNLVGSGYETKFRKNDGGVVGGSIWDSTQLIRPTDELRERFNIACLTKKARRLWENVVLPQNAEQLKEIIAVLEKYKNPDSTKEG